MTNFLIISNEILRSNELGNRAKVLFARLYSRRKLSFVNGFTDTNGEPYVFCSAESAAKMLSCSRKTAQLALKELENAGYIQNSGAKNRFYIQNISGDFTMIPTVAADLGCDCAVLYAHIAAQIQSGLRTFCTFKISQIQDVLCCGNKKAIQLLAKLKSSRLIEIRRTGKGNVFSLCGDMAKTTLRIISKKIEKIKAKSAEKSAFILSKPDVDVADAKCDFFTNQSVIFATKIYNNKINNINYISSKSGFGSDFGSDFDEQKRDIAKKLSFENYESRHKNTINALKSAIDTKRKRLWVGGKMRTMDEIVTKIASLSTADIADVCENVQKRKDIYNLKGYVLACLMNYSAKKSAAKSEHSYNLDDFDKLAVGIAPCYN